MTMGPVPELAGLGEAAPPGLAEAVFARLGLGDEWVSATGPVGVVFAAYNRRGVSFVSATADAAVFAQRFAAQYGDRPLRPATRPPAGLLRALETGRGAKRLRYDLAGLPAFQQAVLAAAVSIPYGEVRSYAWVARQARHPRAVRAAGTALGRNPVPFLVPCHRVVRTDGRIGHYAFGAEVKRAILTAEGVDLDELEAWARTGIQVVGSATTGVYCVPTCRAARRIQPRHRRPFRSADLAGQAGYRPCLVCRPGP